VAYLYVFTTIVLTVYGQIIVKWQVTRAGALPRATGDKVEFLLRLAVNPWIITVFAGAFIAALAWFAAMTKLELSHAYPFMALSFVLVLLLSGLFLGETITAGKVAGIVLIGLGIVVGSSL
jgi:drug/metabolite transporter (DMT)-like permease